MIDSYDFGHIVIDGKRYHHDVVIFQDKVESWWRREGHRLHLEDIEKVIEERPDVLIVGTGYSGLMRVLPEVEEKLNSLGIGLVAEKTKDACQAYNRVKDKKVIATLHLTC
ncbi:MAG: Mth938-like domain-containing protein [Candidatus Hydrothermarchaeales archaeon]